MAASAGVPRITLKLKVAFASEPEHPTEAPSDGPYMDGARMAVGHLYGLSSEEASALHLWHWDAEGHAHGVTEETMAAAQEFAIRSGAELQLIAVPGAAAGRPGPVATQKAAVRAAEPAKAVPAPEAHALANGPVPAQQAVPAPVAHAFANGPVLAQQVVLAPAEHPVGNGPEVQETVAPALDVGALDNGPGPQQVATPPVEAVAPLTAWPSTAAELAKGSQGSPQEGCGSGAAAAAAAPAEEGAEGAEAAAAGPAASAEAETEAVIAEPDTKAEAETQARQAHRMDVTVFAPELPHSVPDQPAAAAEARERLRMD